MVTRSTRREPLRFLSLCSGIGGIDLAAEMAGMQIVGQVEIDPYCQRVLAKHWPNVKRVDDIRKVWGYDFGSVDVIAAGFPCQPASVAGQRRGAADDRWLWPEVLRVVQVYEPTWLLLENVPGLISLGLDDVLADLDAAGYEAWPLVFPAAAVGAPHLRERLFVVAHAQCLRREWRQGGATGRDEYTHEWAGQETAAHTQAASARGNGVADANEHSGRWQERTDAGDVGSACGASAPHEGYSQRHADQCGSPGVGVGQANSDSEWQSQSQGSSRNVRGWPSDCGEDVADATGDAWQHQQGQWQGIRDTTSVNGAQGAVRTDWQAQPRVGGDPNGLSRGMDSGRRDDGGDAFTEYPRHCWPAGPSEPQAPWEPPRTVTGTAANRAARLKALGNAVVPQQVFPILAAIVAAEREANHASA